jgi:multiple sugar transport system substrate-binding protein
MTRKIFLLLFIFIFLITSGFGCKMVDKEVQEAMKPITLEYWRVWDGPDAFEEIITAYNQLHPFIKINYKKLRYSEYERELLEAMAEDRGPDIFSIHNTWVKKYQNMLTPMPDTITMAYPIVKGSIKKEVIPELRTKKSLSLGDLQNNFVDVVYGDVVYPEIVEKEVVGERIYALPLSVDTLAMYYNKDLLNNSGIPETPSYWNTAFQQTVKKLTKQDTKGNIIQSGVALGGSTNIERYSDILSVLMMQNGTVMLEDGRVLFHSIPSYLKNDNIFPGLEALRFYTDFANPAKEVYSWNSEMENSLNLFIQGKLALFFGYAYHLPEIKTGAPKLNFGVAKLPQIEGSSRQINFANYWVEGVSKKSEHITEAWDFVQFMASSEQVKKYLDKVKKPTALRALVNDQAADDDIKVFVEQVLTAKSWYKGDDANAAEIIIGEMIDSMVRGDDKPDNIIKLGAGRVQQTLEK